MLGLYYVLDMKDIVIFPHLSAFYFLIPNWML